MQGRNKTVDLPNGFGTPNTEDRKKKYVFLHCLLYHLFPLLGDTEKSEVLFARTLPGNSFYINVTYFLSHYFPSRTPGLESC